LIITAPDDETSCDNQEQETQRGAAGTPHARSGAAR
jgi:hypothetical protein